MSLFPQLSENFYVDGGSDILKLMDYTYAKNITINQSYWSEADTDLRFHCGDQTIYNDLYGNLPVFRRKQFCFNRIRRINNMISGYQRQHRKSLVCTAVESSDEKTSDQFTKLLYHVCNHGGVNETFSDAFEGAVKCGMNLLSVWLDYRSDPVNGDIVVSNSGYSSYMIDPYFKCKNLSDCNNIWGRKYISRTFAATLLPGREDEIKGMRGWGNRDGKFQFMPEAYNYSQQDLLIYDEFWYMDHRKAKNLVDIESGECTEWRGSDEDLREFLKMFRNVIVTETVIPSVKLAIVVQGQVMYDGPNPLGIDGYNHVPVWCYYEPDLATFPMRVQGTTRGLRDSNYLYNRRKIIELDILESQINSGFKYKEDALVNPKDVFLSGQGKGLALKSTAQMTDVEQIMAPQVPPSMMQLSEGLAREMQEISGVNEELLGSAIDDKAGILSMVRQGASLTTLQVIFDNADSSLKLLGDKMIEVMQRNWTPGKVRRILNEEPSPQFYNRAFMKYKAVVEEGQNTTTQRQLQFGTMIQMKQLMPDLITSKMLLEASTIPNKSKIIEELQQQEQQQSQQQQQQMQMQMQIMAAQIEDLKSKAMANEGLGMERASRIHENQALAVERRAAAEREHEAAELDKVKALKELATIDLSQLQQAIEILKLLETNTSKEKVANS